MYKHMAKVLKVNPWCGLCGSVKTHYESGDTAFTSLPEAMDALHQVELANIRASVLAARLPKPN